MGALSSAPQPFIGIVTVLYDSDAVLPDFFASLALQTDVRWRLYVIDNSATDSGTSMSRALAARHGVDAVCVFNGANVGVARGNNQGVALALADGCSHVLLSNNDTAFGPGTIAALLAALVAAGCAAATPQIMFHDRPSVLWYGGGHIARWTMRNPHHGEGEIDRGQFDEQGFTGYAPTCFMLIDRSVFEVVGLMDERYFVYYDDTDFVMRLHAGGLRLLYVPSSVVLHKVSSSTGGSLSPFTVYYTNRNRIYLVLKNLRGLQRIVALSYLLMTRTPRLMAMPAASRDAGWRGVRDGFRLFAQARREARR